MSVAPIEHVERDGFRLRGLAPSRLDGFSDVVFGFALTLLVVSLQVPRTFAELHQSVREFFPFAVVFYILVTVWLTHYRFFRRFGTHDSVTLALNSTLLFVVLFFVYPLKFLFSFAADAMMGLPQHAFDSGRQVRELMVLYGAGFAAIYFLFAALYWNGLRQRKKLALSDMEVTLTRGYIIDAAGVGSIGVLSCVVALILPLGWCGNSGWVYMLIGVFKSVHGYRTRRQLERRGLLPQ